MESHWHFEHYRPSPSIEKLIQWQVRSLELQAARFNLSAISLEGRVTHGGAKRPFELTLVLKLPQDALQIRKQGTEVEALLRVGFQALGRELDRYYSKRQTREPLSDSRLIEADEDFRDAINRQLPRLCQYVEREIGYFLSTGELPVGAVRVEDIVDETVMRALTEYDARPPQLPLAGWLITLAKDVLDAQVRQNDASGGEMGREEARVEQQVAKVPPEHAGAAIEDEMYYWYQPDEDLRVEDIVADPHTRSPEEIAAQRQLQHDLDQMIAFLPKRWRDVFVLHMIEGFTMEQVALVTGVPREHVERDLRAARDFLRQRLTDVRVSGRGEKWNMASRRQ